MRAALAGAVADVATAAPDRVLVGISALAFMGGMAGHRELLAVRRRPAARR